MTDRVTASEIARHLGISLSAVSNWRRRHESFPTPVNGDQFSVDEVATWLDTRKISKDDRTPQELPGTTYATRFRTAMNLRSESSAALNARLWKELSRIGVGADLVLGLLCLAAWDEQWDAIVASDGESRTTLVTQAAMRQHVFIYEPFDGEQLAAVVRLVEETRLSGRVIEVFDFLLDRFAAEEGRRDASVHTPPSLVRLLVALADAKPNMSVFDPYCGFGEFLVGAAEHVGGSPEALFIGHALSARAASLARMNLRLHGVRAEVDILPSKYGKFDIVLSNPPFDLKASTDYHGLYGRLPKNRTSFMWLERAMSSLTEDGRAAVVMPGGTLFRGGAEVLFRAGMVDEGAVEAIIALPPQLFAATAVPVTVWLLRPRGRSEGEILFLDASGLGHMVTRTQRSLSDEDRRRIVDTVERWRTGGNADEPGFSASVAVERIREQDYVLVPARYVGAGSQPETTVGTVEELRYELARLERRAAEVNAVVEERLDGIRSWIR
jgi:type I restriction enzyme M protein